MLALLRNRNYSLLWFSQLISMVGFWAMFTALPFFVFQLTGSVLATGIMFIVEVIPPVLLGSIAGVFVDRWDRRWTMIGSNLVQGAVLLLLLGIKSADQVWIVYVVAVVQSIAGQFFNPANNALLPRLVGSDELVTANSLDALGENIARIIGPTVGGVLLASFGIATVALINVASFAIAVGLIYLIKAPGTASDKGPKQSIREVWLSFWREWASGLRLVFRNRPLSFAFLIVGISLLGDSILSVLLVVFVQDVVGAGAEEFGWILTARGIGGVLGGLIVAKVGPSVRPKNLLAYGMAGSGVLLFIMLQFPVLPVILAAAVAVGLPVMAWLIAGQTWLQTHTEDQYRGRIFGAFQTYAALMGLLGMGFATFAGEAVGVVLSMTVGAILYISAGVLAFVILQERFIREGSVAAKTGSLAE
jgi:MFS family permease